MTTFADRAFPHQMFNNHLYNGPHLLYSLVELLQSYSYPDQSIKLQEHDRIPASEMSTSPLQLDFLKFWVDITGAKRVLEVGTFVGSTAIALAKHGCHVTTIEKFDEFYNIAMENIEANGVKYDVDMYVGDAGRDMCLLPDSHFDLIYIDGDKGNYLTLTQLAEKKLAPGGTIIIDDVFFHGDVLNAEPTTEKGRGCRAVLDHHRNTTEYHKYLLPIQNGLLILKRKD